MNGEWYLAIDIGASSGRHIAGRLNNGVIELKEIYRFENKLVERNGHLCWDLENLFQQVVKGLMACKETGCIPKSIGIDTWGVDFVLLDKDGAVLGDTVAYRDGRTKGIDEEVYKKIGLKELYNRTGIQKLIFNTVYQLTALRKQHPKILENAEHFLMIPDYLNYLLTGVMKNEYTNATTTQLVNATTASWDWELLTQLKIPTRIFKPLSKPGTVVGQVTAAIKDRIGFDTTVVLPATHDTGSAVMAVPMADDDSLYVSSGTWALMGIERDYADCSEESEALNFTNEGGYEFRYRYLKNIMGMWMLQNLRKEFTHKYTFEEQFMLAKVADYFTSVVDVNDESFLAPTSMKEAIREYCVRTGQAKPETDGEFLMCIYRSLVACYEKTIGEIEKITGKTYKTVHIVGGGCQDAFLNSLLAATTGKQVYAGPIEATALGNVLAQMIQDEQFKDLQEARMAIRESFAITPVTVGAKTITYTI